MLGAIGPVVSPANDHVTSGSRMTVISEISTLVFEFYSDPLPFAWTDLPLRFAVRVPCLYGFDQISEFSRHHSEQKDDPLFVNRLMAQAPKIDGVTVGRDPFQLVVPMP